MPLHMMPQSHLRWAVAEWILYVFHENGGLCREPIDEFENRHGYHLMPDQQNNCIDSSLGLLVTGECHTSWGMYRNMPRGADKPPYILDLDEIKIPVYQDTQSDFEYSVARALALEDIKPDIPLSDITKVFPVVTFIQPLPDINLNYDTHFTVPHIENYAISFSSRNGYQGDVKRYDVIEDMTEELDLDITSVNVFFVPNDYMGTRIKTVSHRMAWARHLEKNYLDNFMRQHGMDSSDEMSRSIGLMMLREEMPPPPKPQ